MAWTPSEGLKRADAVVGEIEQAIEATHPGPVRRHRLMEIVAKAIDGPVARAVNGHAVYTAAPPPVTHSLTMTGDRLYPGVGTEPEASEQVMRLTPGTPHGEPKKRRGRPKGSTKKKAKAAKPEAPAEASE